MAKHGEDRYYQRVGGRFVKMEHYAVADMFGRRRRPHVDLRVDAVHEGLAIRLQNSGRISARAPFVHIKLQPPFALSSGGIDGGGTWPIPREGRNKYESAFVGDSNLILHPGRTIDVARVHWEYVPSSGMMPRPVGSFIFWFEVATEEIPLQRVKYVFEVSDTGFVRIMEKVTD